LDAKSPKSAAKIPNFEPNFHVLEAIDRAPKWSLLKFFYYSRRKKSTNAAFLDLHQ
jgi:hypothetical protein